MRQLFTVASFPMILALLLASCAPAASPSPPKAEAPVKAPAAETPLPKPATPVSTAKPASQGPKYGGVLTISSVADPPSFDSQQENTINTYMVVAPAYNNIIAYDNVTGRELVGVLAEDWQMSPDGRVYTFKARKGVKFHDGKPMTVEDLAYSLDKITFPPPSIRSNIGFLLKDATQKIEVADPDTLKVTLNHRYAMFLSSLATDSAHVLPKHLLEKDMKAMMKQVVGTGPFKFRSYAPGTIIEFEKNKDYWVKDRPYLDGVAFYIIKDSATRVAALRTGRVKRTGTRLSSLNPTQVESVKATTPQIRFVPEASTNGPGFFVNVRRPPFSDLRVRRAMSLAMDRQAALKTLALGKGMIGKSFPYESWGIPEEELLKMPGFRQPKDADRAEAKKLMAEAGYPDGFQLTILSRPMPLASDAAVFMSNELSSIGVKSTVQTLDDTQFYAAGREGRFQAMVYPAGNVLPDPHYMSRNYEPGGPSNYSGNDDDKKILEMSQEEVRTIDVEKRKALIRELHRYLLEESLVWIPIVWPHSFFGVWPEVQNMILGVITDSAHHDFQEVWLSQSPSGT